MVINTILSKEYVHLGGDPRLELGHQDDGEVPDDQLQLGLAAVAEGPLRYNDVVVQHLLRKKSYFLSPQIGFVLDMKITCSSLSDESSW